MTKKVFIGSTQEGLDVLTKIQTVLTDEHNYECKSWHTNVFHPGEHRLESLLKQKTTFDYAVFILTPSSKHNIENKSGTFLATENLVFEIGFFISILGKEKVAICTQNPPGVKIPEYLIGLNTIDFSILNNENKHDLNHVVYGVVHKINQQFSIINDHERELEPPLSFGDTRFTDIIVDSAFQTTDRKGLSQEIQQAVNSNRVFPTKLFYATEEGAAAWLELTGSNEYDFFGSSISFLRKHSNEISTNINNAMGNLTPDIISLGSGDGKKDAILLEEFQKTLPNHREKEKITYFPIDFSYYLITETINKISKTIPSDKYRIKPIVGDMIDLHSFKCIYNHYENPNLFMILGNTIGNNDERQILDTLKCATSPGHMILIEVNTNIKGIEDTAKNDFIGTKSNLKHIFAPLSLLEYEYKEENFSSKLSNSLSSCPGAKSIETYYKINNQKNIRISVNHRYNFEKFKNWIGESLSCEPIWSREENNVGMILLKKKQEMGQ